MSDCDEVEVRVAKLEVRTDNHENLIMQLDRDIQALHTHLDHKIDKVVDKALDTVPPWFAKFVVTISVVVVCAALGLHHFHVF